MNHQSTALPFPQPDSKQYRKHGHTALQNSQCMDSLGAVGDCFSYMVRSRQSIGNCYIQNFYGCNSSNAMPIITKYKHINYLITGHKTDDSLS